MAAYVYECMFLLDTTKVAGDVKAAGEQLQAQLVRHKAEILAMRPWDERRLAYPVNGHKKGLYYLTYFRVEGNTLANIERDFHLNEMILRFLILRVDRKLVDAMLALARDEHAMALQSVTEPLPEVEGIEVPLDELRDEPRVPRRGRQGGEGHDRD